MLPNFLLVTCAHGAYITHDVRVLINKLTKYCQKRIEF